MQHAHTAKGGLGGVVAVVLVPLFERVFPQNATFPFQYAGTKTKFEIREEYLGAASLPSL